ncbi:YkgJ family cysteine cluster protein [bacterium]|nr:YkgJ family cysteine cluster protein [bacterium]
MSNISHEQIIGYQTYLKLIHERMLDKYFKEQAPYLCCKDGCAHCCKKGQYPVSEIEFRYILLKFASLEKEKQTQILYNIQSVIKEKLNSGLSQEQFFYRCPFLINDSCSVYENRAIICRTHGLMFFIDDKNKIPSCVDLGLNYSMVYDEEKKIISEELCKKSGIETPPQAYNLSLKTLTNSEITKKLGFEFRNIKPLIEWFM